MMTVLWLMAVAAAFIGGVWLGLLIADVAAEEREPACPPMGWGD